MLHVPVPSMCKARSTCIYRAQMVVQIFGTRNVLKTSPVFKDAYTLPELRVNEKNRVGFETTHLQDTTSQLCFGTSNILINTSLFSII